MTLTDQAPLLVIIFYWIMSIFSFGGQDLLQFNVDSAKLDPNQYVSS